MKEFNKEQEREFLTGKILIARFNDERSIRLGNNWISFYWSDEFGFEKRYNSPNGYPSTVEYKDFKSLQSAVKRLLNKKGIIALV